MLSYTYDKDSDVLYISFGDSDEPTIVKEEIDDFILLEVGITSGITRGIRIIQMAHNTCDHIPNAETRLAIENIENGIGLHEVDSVDELFEELEEIDGIDTLTHLMENNNISTEGLSNIIGRSEEECKRILDRDIDLTRYDKLALGKRFCLDPNIFED